MARPEGAEPVDRSSLDLGGRLTLDGNRVRIDGTVAAPSGRIEIHADEDVELTEGSVLDVAGREVTFFDVTRHSFGGDVVLSQTDQSVLDADAAVANPDQSRTDAHCVGERQLATEVTLHRGQNGANGE